jgi:hypothetical protein
MKKQKQKLIDRLPLLLEAVIYSIRNDAKSDVVSGRIAAALPSLPRSLPLSELANLGYKPCYEDHLEVHDEAALVKVCDQASGKETSFCFLFDRGTKVGIILPQSKTELVRGTTLEAQD